MGSGAGGAAVGASARAGECVIVREHAKKEREKEQEYDMERAGL